MLLTFSFYEYFLFACFDQSTIEEKKMISTYNLSTSVKGSEESTGVVKYFRKVQVF